MKEAVSPREQEEKWSRVYYRTSGDFPDLEEDKPDDPLGGEVSLWDLIRPQGILESFTPWKWRMPTEHESIQERMDAIIAKLQSPRVLQYPFRAYHQKSMITCFGDPGTDPHAKIRVSRTGFSGRLVTGRVRSYG